MLRVLPVVIQLALLVYCLVDCAQAREVRNLPRWAWLLLIVLVPVAGPLAYLLAGRPQRRPHLPHRPAGGARPAPRGPDDDPDFLRDLDRRRRPGGTGPDAAGPDGGKGPDATT
ncbi:PLD nuclease N-terminal domain-containing protein [Kineococcus glutinatus]|uniref:Cardiolipin synthase N-terminal domain-containing protein n=1 Tax=Kineococcus glutinatus TaxID=1070872 RepID=A0ABP8VHD3_9ACTN